MAARAKTAGKPGEVDVFLARLDHPFKKEVQAVRRIILGASPKMEERIKWKAPSFHFGKDFAAFNLWNKELAHLIVLFPMGVLKASPGLLEADHHNRREVKFRDMKEVRAKKAALQKLVRSWIKAVETM